MGGGLGLCPLFGTGTRAYTNPVGARGGGGAGEDKGWAYVWPWDWRNDCTGVIPVGVVVEFAPESPL